MGIGQSKDEENNSMEDIKNFEYMKTTRFSGIQEIDRFAHFFQEAMTSDDITNDKHDFGRKSAVLAAFSGQKRELIGDYKLMFYHHHFYRVF